MRLPPVFLLSQRLGMANRMPRKKIRASLRSRYKNQCIARALQRQEKMAQRLLGATCVQQWRHHHFRAGIPRENMCHENRALPCIGIHMAMCIGHATGRLMQATKKGA
jgi:hypothetical protein